MQNRFQNFLKYLRGNLSLFVIGIFIVIICSNCTILEQKLNVRVGLPIDSKTAEMKPEIDSSLPMLTFIVAALTSIATCLYLFVTWRLLVNGRKEHEENKHLTQRLHSDSLTPYIYLEEIQYNLFVTSKKNPSLRVHQATIIDEKKQTLQINSLSSFSIDDLMLKGNISLKMNNASTNIADSSVSIYGICGVIEKNEIIRPNSSKEFQYEVNNQLHNISKLMSFLSNQEFLIIIAEAKGPGCSAHDTFEADYPINLKLKEEPSILGQGGWNYTKRSRKYN